MDTKNIERSGGKLTFDVVVGAEAFEAELNKAYLKAKKRITVPGFRKGKAPRMVIEGMYGKDVFYEDAVDAIALEAYKAGAGEAGDRTVGDPAITNYQVGDDKSLTISFESALYPEATLGEYKGLTAYKAPVEASDSEVDAALENVRKRDARIITLDGAAKEGNTVNIDFDGYRDGKRFDGGKAEGYDLTLGSGSFVPGFEEQLVGAKAGDELNVNITFPEDYAPDLAGADVVFKVRVNEVKETQLPELDDEFAKDVSEFDTLDEYKESIRKELQEQRAKTAEENYRNLLLRKASENMTVELPDAMVNARVNEIVRDLARRCNAQGMTLERYFQMMGMDERTYRNLIRGSAASDLRVEVLLEKVAEVENITVTAEEIEAEYKTAAEQYEVGVEEVKKSIPEDAIERDLKMRRAGDLICDSGVPTDVPEDAKKDGESKAEDEGEAEAKPKKTRKRAAKKEDGGETGQAGEAGEQTEKKPARKTTRKGAEKSEEKAEENTAEEPPAE